MSFIKNNKAFTLIQLIVGVSVVVILSTTVFLIVNPSARNADAQDLRRNHDVEAIGKAVELYQTDNDALPDDIAAAVYVDDDQKYVLCSSSASLTCDGQTRDCVVVDDVDFLDAYLGGALPVDPTKSSSADTGYYIARNGDQMVFGSCANNSGQAIEYIALAKMPPLCGNSIIDSGEVCDDGNLITEGCASGTLDTANTYCNSTCSATVVVSSSEPCDYANWSNDCKIGGVFYTTSDVGGPSYCSTDCVTEQSIFSTCEGGGGAF